MRQLRRNQQSIWYARYIGEQPVLDDDGRETAETAPAFSTPTELKCNVSGGKGEWAMQVFGGFTDYSRTISLSGTQPLSVGDRVWVSVQPEQHHDYVVASICEGLCDHLIALQEVPNGT